MPADDLQEMAALTRFGAVPVLADEGIFTAHVVLAHAREGAAQIVSVKLVKAGVGVGIPVEEDRLRRFCTR